MNTKIVFQCDENGYFLGPTEADESPLEPGIFHVPGGCVEVEPPTPENEQQIARFLNGAWLLEEIQPVLTNLEEEEPEDGPLTAEQVIANRRMAYALESDPLKMEADHDAIVNGAEPDYAAWLAKVADIKLRHPMPEDTAA